MYVCMLTTERVSVGVCLCTRLCMRFGVGEQRPLGESGAIL